MPTIQIQNIGPLKDTGNISLSQIMLLIGEQSTGKSTFMKILCFCSWVEKQVMMNEKEIIYKYTHYHRFWNELKKFFHFNDDFLKENSLIKYHGHAIRIEMQGKLRNAKIILNPNFTAFKHNTKLSFLPSERNLLSSLQNVESLYRAKDVDMLFNYILEWGEARTNFDASHQLGLVFAEKMKYYYDTNEGDIITIADGQSKIKPYYASSGVQSALPVQVLSSYLASVVGTSPKISPIEYLKQVVGNEKDIDEKSLTSMVRNLLHYKDTEAASKLYDTFPSLEKVFKEMQNRTQYKSFHLFVEELEQNLFPNAQFELIKMLVKLVAESNRKQAPYYSSIFLTSHSPYILTALNVMMLAAEAYQKNPIAVRSIGLSNYVLPINAYSAYRIKNGYFEDIIDTEYHFIKGEYLDSISEDIDQYSYQLNNIVYGNTGR